MSSPTDTYWDNNVQNNVTSLYLSTNKPYMLVWIEGGASSVHRTPKKCHFAWSITHTATTHIFGHAHVSFLDKTVHSSSSTLYSYSPKIIGHFEWRKMARGREQVTLEAGFTVSPAAEIDLRCIRRTAIIWPYELRSGSTTCQNDRNEKLYPSVAHFIGSGKILEAKNGLPNCVSDDLIVGVYSPSVFHPSVSAPTDTYWDNNV